MLQTIYELLKSKLGSLEFEVTPADPLTKGGTRGHFSTNAAFVLAGEKKNSPLSVAGELKQHLERDAPVNFFSKIEVAPPGFINFWLTPAAIQKEFLKIVEAGPAFAKAIAGKGGKERVIVEYSQPNIAKPLQAHHFRSTIIGDAIANILKFAGHEVIRWNYLGDWGTHFGKLIALTKRKEPRERWVYVMRNVSDTAAIYAEYRIDAEEEPDLERQAREEFRKLEQGDPEDRKLWEESRSASIENLKRLYKILGIDFDEWIGESFYEERLPKLIQELQEKGIAQESKGALIIPLEKYDLPPALIRKSDGATLYLTRDIASLEHRLEKYGPNSILYVVDNSQTLHFQQLFSIADVLGLRGEFVHIKFGLLLGEDLKKLSTRAGTGVELESVIQEAIKRAREVVESRQPELSEEDKKEIAQVVGIGALKYNDLSQNRLGDIAFDWQKMLSLEGNSAPYLQYTYTRLQSILRKADSAHSTGAQGGERSRTTGSPQAEELPEADLAALKSESDLGVVLKLIYFPEAVKRVAQSYFPNELANYLYSLARLLNSFYEKEPVLKAEPALRSLRLNLIKSAALTLKTGLALLGIKTVERM